MVTEERISKLLPIGSVVMLHNAQKALMIYGVCQTEEKTAEEYDYIGVFYPEGNVGEDTQFLFNQSDVDRVLFTGYETPERIQFLASLKAFYAERRQ